MLYKGQLYFSLSTMRGIGVPVINTVFKNPIQRHHSPFRCLDLRTGNPLAVKTCGGCSSRRSCQSHRRVNWRGPRGHRIYINPPTWESAPGKHLKGLTSLMESRGEWLKADWKPSKWHCTLSDPSLTYYATMQQSGLPNTGEYLRLCPLQCNTCTEAEKYGSNERTDQNSRKRTKGKGDSQPIRCKVQNTGDQDAHINDCILSQNQGRSEGFVKWNKEKIYREPTVKARKLGLKSMIWERRKK